MAPNTIHSKRRTEQLESPIRNKRCMDDRKTTIVDPQLRAHYAKQPPPATGVLETVLAVYNYVARSISDTFAPPPSHNAVSQPTSPKRSKPKPRHIYVNASMDTLTAATQIPLPPSPPYSQPFQDLGRQVETSSPSTKRYNGQTLSVAASPARSFTGLNSPSSSRSPRRGNSSVQANGVGKPYQPRKHIRHKQHKLEVQAKLQQELLELKMANGQVNTVADFNG
ncbi:hypothetical protein BDV93DRAFT_12916 [Ceratobasidium sp. AG-I]|nr:hypothetical protein BDV93DRAFT_12916 [Ceratobasidium sp. AG-I]